MPTTPRGQLPTPVDADPADVPQDMLELATQLAALFVMFDEGPAANRPVAAAAVEGMFYRTTDGADAGKFEYCNGATWIPIAIGGGTLLRQEVRRMKLRDTTETRVALGNVAGNPVNIDLSLGNYFTMTLTGAATLAFTNVPAAGDGVVSVTLAVTQDAVGGRVLTLPAHRKPSGAALSPTTAANARNIYEALSDDGGVSWDIFLSGKDMKV